MANSPTAKEVSIDLAGFKSSVDKQFDQVDSKLARAEKAISGQLSLILKAVGALFTTIPMIIGGGLLLRSELNEVKIEVAKNSEKLSAISDKISALGDDIDRIRATPKPDPTAAATQTQMIYALRRIEDKLNGYVAITLTNDENNIVRSFLKITPIKGKERFVVGSIINANTDQSRFVPDDLANRVPVLTGLRFLIDPGSGAAVFVAANNYVVAVVKPA